MTTNNDFSTMTLDELKNIQSSVFAEMEQIIETTKQNVQNILSMISTPLVVYSVEQWNNRIVICIDGASYSSHFDFYTQSSIRNSEITKYCMSSPYSCGSLDLDDCNDSHLLYYKTYGEIINNTEFLSAIKKIQFEFYNAINPLYSYGSEVSHEVTRREQQIKMEAEQKERDEFFNSIEEFLLNPDNSEKWVAGFATEQLEKKTGITYRNKPFTIKTTVGGTWLFDSERQIDSIKYQYCGQLSTEDDRENHKIFQYTTAVQVKNLKSDKTGKWINRPKKVK